MPLPYNPKDWYWFVAGDETKVYSSKRGDFFPISDTAYQAWLTSGGITSRIVSAAELGEVLAPYNLRPTHAATLDGYTEAQASKLTIENVAKVLAQMNNRLRVLEGKQPIPADQVKVFFKAAM